MAYKKIAVTGGIGSGKSTVCKIIKNSGYSVYSCDKIYEDLLGEDAYVSAIRGTFPEAVVDGRIDKNKLSSIVFSDATARERLNAVAHPLIMQKLLSQMDDGEGLVFAEVPLLFEGKFEDLFDEIIVVVRNTEDRIRAVCMRDNLTRAEVEKRMRAQFDYDLDVSLAYLKKISAHVIKNEGDSSDLTASVSLVLQRLLS